MKNKNDDWSDDPVKLIKQLAKETKAYLKAGGVLTPKMLKSAKKIDKLFKKGLK